MAQTAFVKFFPLDSCPQGSKVDEDYDTYIENLMTQLRQLPPMNVLEPALSRNYAVCSIFGSGDLAKIGTSRDYTTRQGDLKGTFGVAHLAHVSDHYNTQPFGELPPLPPQPAVSTQRGFYDQEFSALKLENDGECSYDNMLLFGVVRYSTNHPAAIYSFLLQM
jgi:histone-lysine N-methyltransferase MLL3